MKRQHSFAFLLSLTIAGAVLAALSCHAQETAAPKPDSTDQRYEQLASKLDQAMSMLDDTQRQLAASQEQIRTLQSQMQAMNARLGGGEAIPSSEISNRETADMQEAVHRLQENTDVLQAEVAQHEQTKVESRSKFPIQITGMMLSSTFLSDGAVDNADLPIVALDRTGSVSHGGLTTSLRQSIVGLDFRGPAFGNAHTGADVRVDFFGGQSSAGYSTNPGTLRLRTAHMHVDWPNTSLIAALDTPLISPLEPTSYVSVGEPAMAWSGNLWSWSPQLEWKHAVPVSEAGRMEFELGLIDPISAGSLYTTTPDQPNPAESSRQPGYEARVAYVLGSGEHALQLAANGYYDRQKYPYRQHVDAWAGASDFKLPLSGRFELSGEFYRGRALGSLGGGVFKDYVTDGDDEFAYVRGLDSEGGWTQFKARILPSLEANAAIGQDTGFGSQIRSAIVYPNPNAYSELARNRTILGNAIFRPRTYLLFSLEYRKIESWQATAPADNSQLFGLAIGYLY